MNQAFRRKPRCFDHLVAVGFQAAVEVVQLDSGSQSRRAVEAIYSAASSRPDRTGAFPSLTRSYPSSVTIRYSSGISSGESCRSASIVITTSPQGRFEAAVESGRFPVVPEPDGRRTDWRRAASGSLPRAVVAAVVHEDDFVREAVLRHHPLDPCEQFRATIPHSLYSGTTIEMFGLFSNIVLLFLFGLRGRRAVLSVVRTGERVAVAFDEQRYDQAEQSAVK